jgi:hypothetical protein
MSIKDLINQAYTKDAESFESSFADIMADKMESSLGAKYDEMFGTQEETFEEEVDLEEAKYEDEEDEDDEEDEEDED